jgi:hypothetical protein
MRKKSGFTVMEMLVGSLVLLIVIGITMSFFRYQSKFGGELRKDMGNKETIGLATLLLKRDLIQAGAGLADNHPLALLVSGYASGFYHTLYVNYGYYLTMKYKDPNGAVYVDSIYKPGYFLPENLSPAGTLTLNRTGLYDVGCILTYVKSTNTWAVIDIEGSRYTSASPNFGQYILGVGGQPQDGTPVVNTDGSTSFTFTAPASGTPLVPAISYRLIDADTSNAAPPYPLLHTDNTVSYPELQRNGLRIAGGKKDPFMRFTDFSIRVQFVNSFSGTANWSPVTTDDFTTYTFDDLKMVEITIKYQTITPGADPSVASNWKQQISKVFTVSPRNVLMMANYK